MISRAKLLQKFNAERPQGIRNRQKHNGVDIRNKQKNKANAACEKAGEDNPAKGVDMAGAVTASARNVIAIMLATIVNVRS